MFERIIVIIAVLFGLVAILIQNYIGAFACFGYVGIVLCLIAIEKYLKRKEGRK